MYEKRPFFESALDLGRGDPFVWVGMTDRITEGTWAYESSGETPPAQPNCHTNKDDVDCTVMKVHYIAWYTFGCHQKCSISASAICEWVITTTTATTTTTTSTTTTTTIAPECTVSPDNNDFHSETQIIDGHCYM